MGFLPTRAPLVRELAVPPQVLRTLAARDPARYPLLLDSAAEGPLSAASVLLALPRAALTLSAAGTLSGSGMRPEGASFLEALEHWWRAESTPAPRTPAPLPLHGGWALFLGYELAQEVEPHLRLPATPLPWVAFALRTPCALVHELGSGRVFATAEPGGEAALDALEADARSAAAAPEGADTLAVLAVQEEDPQAYLARVRARQGVRARGRHLPGEPVALLGRARALRRRRLRRGGALPAAAPGEPGALCGAGAVRRTWRS